MAGKIVEFTPAVKREDDTELWDSIYEDISGLNDETTLLMIDMAVLTHPNLFGIEEVKAVIEGVRKRRIEAAQPEEKPAVQADEPGMYYYTPEMGEQRPVGCQLDASLGHYGKHWYVRSPKPLKGRGIEFVQQWGPEAFTDGERNPLCGWYEYRVTVRAFEKLKEEYSISKECYLD